MTTSDKLSIKDIRHCIQQNAYTEEQLKQWKNDDRKGVQQLVRSLARRITKDEEKKKQYVKMCSYESQLQEEGQLHIAGIDEAGRGPLAGPVVAASVILPAKTNLYGLTDSKQLSEKERNYFYEEIKKQAISYNIQMVDHTVIDDINIYEATKKAMCGTIQSLDIVPDHVLIDAVPLAIDPPTTVLTKGDQKSISIAAASVLAKVTRDRWMDKVHEEFPAYQFAQHKGYGTKVHLEMLKMYGPTPYHRMSFAPVKQAIIDRS